MEEKGKINKILSNDYQKITVMNIMTNEEIAVITNIGDTPINTASANIVVKLMLANCDTEIIVEPPLRMKVNVLCL